MTVTERLAEAREALHLLMIGKRASRLTFDRRGVEYSTASEADLRRYIADLEAELAAEQGCRPRRRNRYVQFGG